jgi:translation initiation factor IF-1
MVEEVKGVLKVPATALRFMPPQGNPPSPALPPAGGRVGKGVASGVEARGRVKFSLIWIKEGDSLKPRRVVTGISDGLNTEVHGKIREGDEVVLSMTTGQTGQAGQQQQQNPFMPQPPRGGRGGR